MGMPESAVGVSAWRTAISRAFVRLDIESHGAHEQFAGAISGANSGPVRADRIEVRAAPHTVRRSSNTSDGGGRLLVSVQLRGTCIVSQSNRTAVLKPSDAAIYDTSRPYELTFPEGDHAQVVVQVPRTFLPLPDLDDALAVPIFGGAGAGCAAAPLLEALPRALAQTPAPVGYELVRTSMEILALGLRDENDLEQADGVLLMAQRFIATNADSPALNPGAVARAAHVSLGHLHRIFRRSGSTVARTILRTRLERCADDLQNPRLRSRSVTRIAIDRGFTDAAHFTRAFTARYGVPPTAWRRQSLGG